MWLTIFRNTIMLSQTKPMLHVACDASSQATVLCSPPPRMDTRIERSLIVRNTTRTITLLTRSRPPSLHKSQMPRKMLLHCPPNNAPARARIAPLLLLPLLGALCQTVRIIAAAAAAAAAAARHTLPNHSDHRCCCCYCCCSPLCLLRGSPLCAGDHRLARGRKRKVLVALRLQLLRQTVGERLSGGGGGGG